MIITNYDLSQHSGHHHFSKFNYDVKAYTADADIKNSNCFNEKKQIYHTVDNNNNSEKSENQENNSAINFALSESF